jgi:hypothetical protein
VNSRLTTGQLICLAAAVLVLLCFFFPWIQVNLFLASINLSGFQLATGSGPAGSNFPGVPSLLLVPLSMAGVLVLLASCFFGSGSTAKTIAALLLVAGGISALIILYQYFNLNQHFNRDPLGMIAQNMFSYSFGAHASLLGSVVVVGGGLLDLARAPKAKSTETQ